MPMICTKLNCRHSPDLIVFVIIHSPVITHVVGIIMIKCASLAKLLLVTLFLVIHNLHGVAAPPSIPCQNKAKISGVSPGYR